MHECGVAVKNIDKLLERTLGPDRARDLDRVVEIAAAAAEDPDGTIRATASAVGRAAGDLAEHAAESAARRTVDFLRRKLNSRPHGPS